MKFEYFLTLVFLILKVSGYINWNWGWIFSPVIILWSFCLLVILYGNFASDAKNKVAGTLNFVAVLLFITIIILGILY